MDTDCLNGEHSVACGWRKCATVLGVAGLVGAVGGAVSIERYTALGKLCDRERIEQHSQSEGERERAPRRAGLAPSDSNRVGFRSLRVERRCRCVVVKMCFSCACVV